MAEREGVCPYTISGRWPDPELTKIIEDALADPIPNPKCPKCRVEGVLRGGAQANWIECPKCRERIGNMHFD